jgi:hypothetical protein
MPKKLIKIIAKLLGLQRLEKRRKERPSSLT